MGKIFCFVIWSEFDDSLNKGKLVDLLSDIQNDRESIFCFQEEYAVVAIPVKRMQETVADLHSAGLLERVSNERKEYLETIIKGTSRGINIWC